MSDSTFERYAPFINKFAECRVLCIGDVMLDKFIYGQVDRISPEAPIPVFAIRDEQSMLGGAGNVVRNLVALEGNTSFISVIGNDKAGHEITSMIGREPRIVPYLITEHNRVSTTKTRYVASNQQIMRADNEVRSAISEVVVQKLISTAREELQHCNILLLSDYSKGLFTPSTLRLLIEEAHSCAVPVIIDPKSRDFSLYRGASCVCPNLQELSNAAGRELSHNEEIIREAHTLAVTHDIEYILVTRSRDGMTLVAKNGDVHHISAHAREVYDVSGAGDTVIATLALGVASGLEYKDAATIANIAAGIVVGRVGTAVATSQDVRNSIFATERVGSVQKIVPFTAAAKQVERWKREGYTIGFTNGCFDLMHPGHLALLHQAKSHSDKLIVGVNSDGSVKRLKGESRPVNGEVERALLLASLSAVDMVVIFEGDTPLSLIESIKPDILVKGADYQKHQVVGFEIVEGYGGKIILVPLKQGYSTTNIIKKIG